MKSISKEKKEGIVLPSFGVKFFNTCLIKDNWILLNRFTSRSWWKTPLYALENENWKRQLTSQSHYENGLNFDNPWKKSWKFRGSWTQRTSDRKYSI